MSKKTINWLASYPKSGNTWVRCFLRAYQFDAYEPIDINQIGRISETDSRRTLYAALVGDDAELTDQNINAHRFEVQSRLADRIGFHQVAKTHNARVMVDGVKMINEEFTRCAIYLVRNPLDLVDSLADHSNLSIDNAIKAMNDRGFVFGGSDPEQPFVSQYLDSWSNHVKSWTETKSFPILVLRYEDLLEDPKNQFTKLIQFLSWTLDHDRIERAIKFSDFRLLKNQEHETGFKEVSQVSKSGRFFRKGQAGNWSYGLTEEQINRILQDHSAVMSIWGYANPLR